MMTTAMKFRIEPNYSMTFSSSGKIVGTLDFNGPVMAFTGDADAAARVFFDCVSRYFSGRFKSQLAYELQIAELQQRHDKLVASNECRICGCVAPHSHNNVDTNGHYRWMAVDLDGTLAEGGKHIDPMVVGAPIPLMIERVKDWVRDGIEVRIFTARTSLGKDDRNVYAVTTAIQDWCEKHVGHRLPVTNIKGHGIIELWDDRAVDPDTKEEINNKHPKPFEFESTLMWVQETSGRGGLVLCKYYGTTPAKGDCFIPGINKDWIEEELIDGDRICDALGLERTEGGRLPMYKILAAIRSKR